MTKKELEKAFKAFSGTKVLIIGDIMIDAYLWGKVNRISPEAPVPVVLIEKKENRLGGAANVALNIQSMGATPILCSVIGVDSPGETFMELLKKQKLSSKGILKSRHRITTVKTRVLSSNHQILRVDEEMESDISNTETEQLLIRIAHLIKSEQIDVIIFEDYDKGLITPTIIQKTISLAKDHKIPVVVDPKRKNFLHYKGVTLFKPNLKELKEGLKVDFDHHNPKELDTHVNALKSKLKCESLLITLSEKGVYYSGKKIKTIIPAHVRNIADVSGAGDTVVSVAALSLVAGFNGKQLAQLANLAGGLVCEKAGVVPIDKALLLEEALKTMVIEKQN